MSYSKPTPGPLTVFPAEQHDHPHGAFAAATAYLATRRTGVNTLYTATRRVDKRYAGDKSFVAPTLARLYDLIACAEGLDALSFYECVLLANHQSHGRQYLSGVDDNGMHLYRLDFSLELTDSHVRFVPYDKHNELEEFAAKRHVERRRYDRVERRAWNSPAFEAEPNEVNFLLFEPNHRMRATSEYAARNYLKDAYTPGKPLEVTCERYTYGKKDRPVVATEVAVTISFI